MEIICLQIPAISGLLHLWSNSRERAKSEILRSDIPKTHSPKRPVDLDFVVMLLWRLPEVPANCRNHKLDKHGSLSTINLTVIYQPSARCHVFLNVWRVFVGGGGDFLL